MAEESNELKISKLFLIYFCAPQRYHDKVLLFPLAQVGLSCLSSEYQDHASNTCSWKHSFLYSIIFCFMFSFSLRDVEDVAEITCEIGERSQIGERPDQARARKSDIFLAADPYLWVVIIKRRLPHSRLSWKSMRCPVRPFAMESATNSAAAVLILIFFCFLLSHFTRFPFM